MRQTALAYAQVRIQARHAALPTETEWRVIETGRSFAQTLDAVKRTSLAPHVARLGRDSDIAAIERSLCASWGETVEAVANWTPMRWRPALLWLKPLAHLRFGQATWPEGLLKPAEARLLTGDDAAIGQVWQREFADRLPQPREKLGDDVDQIWTRFAVGPARSADDTAALAARLERALRRRPQQPAALFAWLGLVALTLERLRGALLLARVFAVEEPTEAA